MLEKYTNENGKECFRGVEPATPLSDLCFHDVEDNFRGDDAQVALHTNLGSLTVLDRLTGYSGYVRDVETGYRDIDGKFWLASGNRDVRHSGATTMQEAINWVKENANTCIGA